MSSNPLYSNSEFRNLESWSFIKDFQRDHQHYVNILTIFYYQLVGMSAERVPEEGELVSLLQWWLAGSKTFDKMVESKLYVQNRLERVFLDMFARYVVSELWDEITKE